jgi:integrase
MSVRKRKWKTGEAWVVDYVDAKGRHIETFRLKKDADARWAQVKVNIKAGTHTAPSRSITVKEAAENWLKHAESEKLERSTLEGYQQHVSKHILPRIGNVKIANLTMPSVNAFADELKLACNTKVMAKKVLGSLKAILKEAQRRGAVAQNVAAGVSIKLNKRDKQNLKVGEDIPTLEEVAAIVRLLESEHQKADSSLKRWRPLILTAIFTGLRASELRGLRREDVVDLRGARPVIHVRQRADRYYQIGVPKSRASERVIPLPPIVANTLKEWFFALGPKEGLGLVFPNPEGGVESLKHIVQRGLQPAQVKAGVVKNGKAKYPGLHSFRHFYASWCLNSKDKGGRALPLKEVQALLGHSSITMTADVYGHLMPIEKDHDELAKAQRALLGY